MVFSVSTELLFRFEAA